MKDNFCLSVSLLALLAAAAVACGTEAPEPVATTEPTTTVAATVVPTDTPVVPTTTATFEPTATPEPTPLPTQTLEPTAVSIPQPTPTLTPVPTSNTEPTATATAVPTPGPIRDLRVSTTGIDSIILEWSLPANADEASVDSYEVIRDVSFGFDKHFSVAHPETEFTDTGLDSGKNYEYRVKAVAGETEGPEVGIEASTLEPPATPTPEPTDTPTPTLTPTPTATPEPTNATTTWRGLVLAPEDRCSPYDSDDYPYSQSVEAHIVADIGGIYGPYTGRWFDNTSETDIEHIVARSEAHDSGLCAANDAMRREFAADLLNLTLAGPTVNRHQKSDKDAAEWLPDMNTCWFADRVIQVRLKYELTVDQAEADALGLVLTGCSSVEMVVVSAAESVTPTPTPTPGADVDALALWDDNGNGRITCAEARNHGIAPVRRGHPAYRCMRDADGDGVVCES